LPVRTRERTGRRDVEWRGEQDTPPPATIAGGAENRIPGVSPPVGGRSHAVRGTPSRRPLGRLTKGRGVDSRR